MINVVGVRFRTEGKVYYFDPGELEIKRGDHVIVETARGMEYASITFPKRGVTDDKVVLPLKPVIRVATEEDAAREAENRIKEKEAIKICQEKIEKYGLEMKLVATEYTFDRNKLLFYFTADGRVDFRELVKDLASVFRTRIELRQIGVRDETKMKGGIGICGRCLCCSTYLSDFAPVSIRMAKDQNLSLNPTKISGACGRLMCCLKNEQETYEYLNKQLPKHGEQVTTIEGLVGSVQSVSVLRQRVKVMVDLDGDEKELREYPVEELSFRGKKAVRACGGEGCAKKAEHHPDHTAKLGTELSSMDQEEAALAAAMDSSDAKRSEEEKKKEKRSSDRNSERNSERRSEERSPRNNRNNKNRNRNNNNRPKQGHEKGQEQNAERPEKRKGKEHSQNPEKRNNNRSHGHGNSRPNQEGKNTAARQPSRRREGWDNQLGGMSGTNAPAEAANAGGENKTKRYTNRNKNRSRRPSGGGQNTQQKQKAEVKE